MSARTKWRGLDGLRAVAALSVAAFHLPLIPHMPAVWRGGWLCVDVFFVLSGFLITSVCLGDRRESRPLRLRRFYLRRLLRLSPPLALMLAVALAVVAAVPSMRSFAPGTWRSVLPSLTWWMNVHVAATGGGGGAVVHLWSLSTEEQFYLLWAPVLLLTHRRVRRRTVCLALLAVAVALPIVRTVATGGMDWPHQYLVGYFSPLHSEGLFVGCALAFALDAAPPVARLSRRWSVVVAGCAGGLVVMLLRVDVTRTSLLWAPLTASVAAVPLVLTCVWWPQRAFGRLLAARPLAWLGERSYAFYLWQLPVIVLFSREPRLVALGPAAEAAVGLAATLGLSVVSWLAVERPAAALRHRIDGLGPRPRHATRPAPAELRPAVTVVGVRRAGQVGLPSPPPLADRIVRHPLWSWPLRVEPVREPADDGTSAGARSVGGAEAGDAPASALSPA